MIYLRSLRMAAQDRATDAYPFNLPLIENLDGLTFEAPITFFVGENGTGKSTMLEAIAAAIGAITVGGDDVRSDASLAPARRLAKQMTLSWAMKTHRGFFMRAEDFYNFGARTTALMRELDEQAAAFEQELSGYGLQLARSALLAQRAALERRYGEDLNARSHGESFMQVFQSRFVPGGLYLLDEPDTALSPQRQLALLALLKDMVAREAQFIIATHSPIVLAFPGATLLLFDGQSIVPVAYDTLENVTLTRSFLANPAAFLRHL